MTLNLTINNSANVDTTATACDSLMWHGLTYFSSGTYFDSLQTIDGCDSVITLNLTINPSPTIDLGADTTLICAGTSETLDAGTGFSSYLWSDGSTNQTLDVTNAGTYTVTGTDVNGCFANDSVVVDVLTVDIAQNDTTICEGDSVVLLAAANSPYLMGSGLYYSNDFESAIDAEWNKNTTLNFNNSMLFGNYGNDTASLSLNSQALFGQVRIKFDLFIHDTWDGNEGDFWKLEINNQQFLNYTFNNHSQSGKEQSYPGIHPASNPSFSGAYATNLPSFVNPGSGPPSVTTQYKIDTVVNINAQNLTIDLMGVGLQPLFDESWSIDNFELYTSDNLTYNWSPSGETTSSITVQPTSTTTYTVDVTSGTTTCQDSVTITVNPISSNHYRFNCL